MRLALAGLVALFFIGCGRPDRTCDPAVDFVYHDRLCGLPAPGSPPAPCEELGDGRCHLRCNSDDDCPDSAPNCHVLGLANGGDFNCNATVKICGNAQQDQCAPR
jgi:hypothetical protein